MTDRIAGSVIAIEGPDGVGKTTIHAAIAEALTKRGIPLVALAFPGNTQGSLGHLVYRIHHGDPSASVGDLPGIAVQALHVAAHVDALERLILPALRDGSLVLLDRSWWSTWVYGVVAGVEESVMDSLVTFELAVWGKVRPATTFLIRRRQPFRREHDPEKTQALAEAYERLANNADHPIVRVDNEGELHDTCGRILDDLLALTER